MANRPGVSKQYLRFLVQTCNGIVLQHDDGMINEELICQHSTLVMLYPHDSRAYLQVHLIANGTVEIHMGENHDVIGRFTQLDFLDVFPQDDFSSEVCAHIADWIAVSTLFPSTGGAK